MFLSDELIRLEALTLLSISAVQKPFYILICISEHCLRSTLRLFHYNELKLVGLFLTSLLLLAL